MFNYLFTYGLLMPGFKSEVEEHLKKNAKVFCKAKMHGLLFDCGEYPAAVVQEQTEQTWIYGWLYEVLNEENLFKVLDEFEGEEYIRLKKDIELENGTKLKAWVYLYNQPTDNLRKIASGNYFAKKPEQK